MKPSQFILNITTSKNSGVIGAVPHIEPLNYVIEEEVTKADF